MSEIDGVWFRTQELAEVGRNELDNRIYGVNLMLATPGKDGRQAAAGT
jgi:hypothetical protein